MIAVYALYSRIEVWNCRLVLRPTGSFKGSVDGSCEASFKGSFKGSVKGCFNGSFKGSFQGSFEGSFEASFRGSFKGSFRGYFEGGVLLLGSKQNGDSYRKDGNHNLPLPSKKKAFKKYLN